jgi:hypothetical protein
LTANPNTNKREQQTVEPQLLSFVVVVDNTLVAGPSVGWPASSVNSTRTQIKITRYVNKETSAARGRMQASRRREKGRTTKGQPGLNETNVGGEGEDGSLLREEVGKVVR